MDIDLKKLAASPRTDALTRALSAQTRARVQWARQFSAAGKPKAGKRPCN